MNCINNKKHNQNSCNLDFVMKAIDWFNNNGRQYPWRTTRDPYSIFAAEYMLQRTTPGHVLKVYSNFINKYPTPKDIISTPTDEIEKLLNPLGIKRRAILFKKAMEIVEVEHAGNIPNDFETLLKLPGVGVYTARAVMCFAYGSNLSLVDVNVLRILGRALDYKSTKKRAHTDKDLWVRIDTIIPEGCSREFNLALIDLASLVCRRNKPLCGVCPIEASCNYFGKEFDNR